MQTKTKNILVYIAVSVTAIFLVGIGIGIYVVMGALPSPHEIASTLKDEKTGVVGPSTSPAEIADSVRSKETTAQNVSDTPRDESAAHAQAQTKSDKKKGLEAVDKLMHEDPQDNRVCNNLGSSNYFKKNAEERTKSFEQMFDETARLDSVLESFRIPIRTILQDEKVSELFKEISTLDTENMEKSEKQSFLDKIGFYSRLALTAGHLYQRKKEFEALGNRAAHLGVIAKIAALKPELATDLKIRDFCEQIQSSMAGLQAIDVEEERREILKVIEYSGLTPKDLDFDPNEYVKFKVIQNKDRFEISLSDKETPKTATN